MSELHPMEHPHVDLEIKVLSGEIGLEMVFSPKLEPCYSTAVAIHRLLLSCSVNRLHP